MDPDEVEAAGRALKGDGEGIAQTGQDIKSAWGGLAGNYIAPEADTLLAAVDPVATAGDDFGSATGTVGDALIDFAEEVRPILARLRSLKTDAQNFVDGIRGDDDWRKDEDKVNEHNGLNDDVLAAVNDYQAAERTCANAITAIFGGTTFVALNPDGETVLGSGEEAYGFTEAPRGVETPWATPQEYDAPWYEDAWNGIADFGIGIAEDLGGLVGLYGENGWGVSSWSEWGDNLAANYGGMLEGFGALAGFYGENGWGVGSFGEWWGNFSTGWTEFAHAIVPWREWGDRPGYVITQSVLNIGSMFVGAGLVKGIIQGGRRAGGGPDADAPDGPSTNRVDTDDVPIGQRPEDMPSTQELSEALDGLEVDAGRLDGLNDALDDAAGLSERQPAPVGGGERPDGDSSSDRQPGSGDGPSDSVPPSPDSSDSPSDRSGSESEDDGPHGDSAPEEDGQSVDRTPADENGDRQPANDGPDGESGDDRREEGQDNQQDGQSEPSPDADSPESGDPADEGGDGGGDGPGDGNGDGSGTDAGDGGPQRLPSDSRAGQILETLDESRVERNGDGLIESVDGKPVNEYLSEVLQGRADDIRGMVERGEITKGSFGGGTGVNSVVMDRRTGELVEAYNGRRNDIIPEERVHPLLRERMEQMRENGPYDVYDRRTGEIVGQSEFPFNDHPLRHAEVKAINELLWGRGGDVGPEVFSDFQIDNSFPLFKAGPQSSPCCANCTRMVDGAGSNPGMLPYPPGHPNYQRIDE
ncbi:hypothetical protein DEF23_23505 [Marinitenerispora sediminis]|uniref:YwqJ-like deaminase n=1 Tax=Marinitenerispora sediminis TaxID=1931232 RepID=A0A368T027_9ACTN|nr:hypothetical protein DEF28_23860 [Marinitenerispora sediminis]RCV49518.1 hypothetical protein DEF23_23505 [Marinitenerispora sediminis]RCV52330.1 hypothetical protein DEF24_22150 [Marinitenerispora sediminis]